MTNYAVTNSHRNYGGHEINITARNIDRFDGTDIQTDLIVRTVKLWLYLAKQIQDGVKELPEQIAFKSAEESVEIAIHLDETMRDFKFFDAPETRVTVWGYNINLTLHSNTIPQQALGIYWSTNSALMELDALYPKPQVPQSAQDAPNSSATAQQASNTPIAPTSGVIMATRAPNRNTPIYSDGQLVGSIINKIVATANQGSATFQMWGPLGRDYAIHTLYRTDKSGNLKKDYQQVKPLLDGLGLSIEKPEATVNWMLVTRAAHVEKDGKKLEYHNLVSLTPVS